MGSEDGVAPWKTESGQQRNCPHLIAKCLQDRPGHYWNWGGRLLTPFIPFLLDRNCRPQMTTSFLHLGYGLKRNLTVSLKQKRLAISTPKIKGELSKATYSPVLQITGLSPRKGLKKLRQDLAWQQETRVRFGHSICFHKEEHSLLGGGQGSDTQGEFSGCLPSLMC